MPITPDIKDNLIAAALDATKHSYAPYSEFLVGAALLTGDGRIFTGCNVENASYGLTICAERNAICAAVTASQATPQGKIKITAIAAFTSMRDACSPCGACRQFIAEFSASDTVVFYQGKDGVVETTMAELLPDGFRF